MFVYWCGIGKGSGSSSGSGSVFLMSLARKILCILVENEMFHSSCVKRKAPSSCFHFQASIFELADEIAEMFRKF